MRPGIRRIGGVWKFDSNGPIPYREYVALCDFVARLNWAETTKMREAPAVSDNAAPHSGESA